MTEAQAKRLYFPAWSRAFTANWFHDRGTAIRREGRFCQELDRVEAVAAERARQRSCRVSANELRHACHLVAMGHDKSSLDLSNRELDQVLALFRVLADPDDLSARIALDHPEQDARRRLEWAVRNCGLPEAYVRAVCSSKFGTNDWCGLDDVPLRQLMITLKSRAKVRQAAVTELQPAVTANCPF